MTPLPPGSRIGILGSGQLGRMLAVAAAQLGYRVHIYAPESGPAFDVASCFTRAAYDDQAALARFAGAVDVATFEFENIPVVSLERVATHVPLRPGVRSLECTQDRLVEKQFLTAQGVRTAPFEQVDGESDLPGALAGTGLPAILKTRRFGYDGKGQARIATRADAASVWAEIGGMPAVLEGLVRFDCEFSVLLCRAADGAVAFWDVPENRHDGGILAASSVPASEAAQIHAVAARAISRRIAKALDHVGVLTVEFFATPEGPVVNELAPRVHNSGHWTIEGAETSQFENHIRAVCGLPLGATTLAGRGVEMRNLIGDQADDWAAVLAEPGAHLHLYGKGEARAGRKMGHVTIVRR